MAGATSFPSQAIVNVAEQRVLARLSSGSGTTEQVTLSALLTAMMADPDMPTVEPVEAGVPWLNNGVLTRSVGIPPTITDQPDSVAVGVDEVASFTIAATNATSYQWRRDGVEIEGATNTTYEIAAAVQGDDGAEFDCVVTGIGGTVTSDIASLTIEKPLDSISAEIAASYSLSKLRTAYTGSAIQVTRSSDSATQDIGFAEDGTLDTASLLTFVGANTGYVSIWYDQSGSLDLVATLNQRPAIVNAGVLVTDSDGYPSMLFDGVNDSMQNAAIDLTGQTGAMFGVSVDHIATTDETFMMYGDSTLYALMRMNTNLGFDLRHSPSELLWGNTVHPQALPRAVSFTGIIDTTQGTAANRSQLVVNGYQITKSNGLVTGSIPSTIFASRRIAIGGIPGTATFANFKCNAFIIANQVLTGDDADLFYKALGSAGGTYLSAIDTPTTLDFTTESDVSDGVVKGSAYSGVEYTTEATLLNLQSFNSIWATFPSYTRLGVYVDGAYYDSANPNGPGTNNSFVTLPEGSKRVTIYNGLQSKPGSTVIGTWLKSIAANAPLTRESVVSTGGMSVYGDSIACGSDASPIHSGAWVQLVRHSISTPIVVEGRGYRALHDDGTSPALIDALVGYLLANSPTKIWLAIGTNDYGLSRWAAAAFQAAYEALLVAINAADSDVTIYAQTPTVRTSEAANASGSTLGDYRTAISNAASGKAYVTVVDGTAILTTSNLSDAVHPNTAGHVLYADYVKTAAGLS